MSDRPSLNDLDQWAQLVVQDDAEQLIADQTWRAYMKRWPDGELQRFPFNGSEFWYDTTDDPNGRESRTVAGWTRVPTSAEPRDASRQRRYPIAPDLAARGFERGHLIARATGGGLDVNLFPQAWQVNQGRSEEGRRFRSLERLAAANPGALQLTRLLWTDESNMPTYVHLLVALTDGSVVQDVFGNEPTPRRVRA